MAIALLNHISGRSTDLNTFTTPAGNSTGATLIVVGLTDYVAGGGTPGVLSDSQSNTWTKIITSTNDVGTVYTSNLYYCVNPSTSASHTFTYTGSIRIGSLVAAFFSGNDTSAPLDTSTQNKSNSAASIQPGSITPAANNELVITHSNGWTNGQTASIDSSFSIIDQLTGVQGQSGSSALAYIVQTTASAVNPTWTWTSDTGIAATMATFKASAGGGTTVVNHYLALMGVGA